jgi:fused signal recognition particle receptor
MSFFDKLKNNFSGKSNKQNLDTKYKTDEVIIPITHGNSNINTDIPYLSEIKTIENIDTPIDEIVEKQNAIGVKEKEHTIIKECKTEKQITEEKNEKKSFFSKITDNVKSTLSIDKIKEGLAKTRKSFSDNLKKILSKSGKIDESLLSEIEELLISADIGVETTDQIIESLRVRIKKEKWENSEDLYNLLKEEIQKIMIESPSANNDKTYDIPQNKKPYVILVIGVNGVGKTTTIGKLAYNYKNTGKEVIIGAADTFRAAANEQLEIWTKRANVDIVQQQQGADPAAVAFDTLKSAQSKNKDVVIIDTAGRLHNKKHLMDELEKISRVMRKLRTDVPDEVFLILDATTGQNAIFQAKEFAKVTYITGIILTKLDGTAKGGIVIPIANELKIPVKYIGIGEKINDLQPFNAKDFVESLFEDKKEIENK